MRRRQLISLIGGAVAYSLMAKAQTRTRCIGVLTGNVEADHDAQARLRAFTESLYARRDEEENGLHFEMRWRGPDISLQQRYAEELVSLAPDVILATSTATARALRNATRYQSGLFSSGFRIQLRAVSLRIWLAPKPMSRASCFTAHDDRKMVELAQGDNAYACACQPVF